MKTSRKVLWLRVASLGTMTFQLERVGTGKGLAGEFLPGVGATTVIKRSDFGMIGMVPGLGDGVSFTASLEGNHK